MSSDKKVLILESKGSDYGAYFLTRGFRKLLGPDRVRMWPHKNTNNGGRDHYPERIFEGRALQRVEGRIAYGPYFTGCELWADPLFWRFWKVEKNVEPSPIPDDGPVQHMEPLGIPESSDDEIFAMVAAGEFALVVLNGCRWHGSAALHELQATFGAKLPPLALADHDDYPQRRWDFADAFKPAVYFKRSMLRGGHPHDLMFGQRDVPVAPLPFSSMWDLPWVPWKERNIDVFCVYGPTQIMRKRLKEVTLEVTSKYPHLRVMAHVGHPMRHPEYLRTLAGAKVVIDQQSIGTDTLRFWETSAVGGMPVSDFNLCTPPEHLVPETHYLKFDNDMSARGDQQDFIRFRQMLTEAIVRDDETEARARRLYDAVRANHTNEARARYVVRAVRARGHALEGLPS